MGAQWICKPNACVSGAAKDLIEHAVVVASAPRTVRRCKLYKWDTDMGCNAKQTLEWWQAKKMAEKLFWRLRDSMFAMDKRGEGFPCFVAQRVMKYAPPRLKNSSHGYLSKTVQELGKVLGYEWSLDECQEAIRQA